MQLGNGARDDANSGYGTICMQVSLPLDTLPARAGIRWVVVPTMIFRQDGEVCSSIGGFADKCDGTVEILLKFLSLSWELMLTFTRSCHGN